jgi:uncharacterized protein YpbB
MENKQTAVEWFLDQLIEHRIIIVNKTTYQVKYKHEILLEQAKEIEGERMRSYIEEKWKQYRIVTNEEDAWLFKEWLIQQTYGGGKK